MEGKRGREKVDGEKGKNQSVCERERERKGDRVKHACYLHATHPGKQGTRSFVQAGFQGALLGMDMWKLVSICECLKVMDQNKIPSLG